MFRITHVWCSLIMDCDSPKSNECSVYNQRDEWVKDTSDPCDCFAEEYKDRKDGDDDVEIGSAAGG